MSSPCGTDCICYREGKKDAREPAGLREYVEHKQRCVLRRWRHGDLSAGNPEYDPEPACDCGLAVVLAALDARVKEVGL